MCPTGLAGINGGTSISTFLKSVNIHFNNKSVNIDLPVVPKASFHLLIGQDVLLNTLEDLSIHVKSLYLEYSVVSNKVKIYC